MTEDELKAIEARCNAATPIMIKCIAENVMDAVAPDNKRIAP